MLYLCSIEKQRTKHRSAMQQGVNAIAAHMSNHNSIYSKGTIVGIITDMCHCVKEAANSPGVNCDRSDMGNRSTVHIYLVERAMMILA